MTTPPDHTPTIRAIADHAPVKVWSWLITIFGDLARDPGDEISGGVLGALTEGIGIRPEAMRVAVHRLRKDGWIETRKQGRASHYRLSAHGLAETLRASQRIYTRAVPGPEIWHLILTDPACASTQDTGDAIRIAPHSILSPNAREIGQGEALVFEVARAAIPDWMIDAAIPPEVVAGYRALDANLSRIERTLEALAPLDTLDGTLLRLLTLHHWRRALLRHSDLLGVLCDGRWIGTDCRQRSHALLDRLARHPLSSLRG